MIKENEFILSILIENSFITPLQANEIEKHIDKNGGSLTDAIVSLNIATKSTLKTQFAKIFNVKKVFASPGSLDYALIDKTTSVMSNDHRIVPYREENGIVLALIDDPLNIASGLMLQTQLGMPINLGLIDTETFDEILQTLTYADRRQRAISALDSEGGADKGENDLESDKYISAPAISLANTLLEEAINEEASDIHIEPMETEVRVRYRVDGVLVEHCRIALNLYQALLARYKIMAELDIAERRVPQDGKITMSFGDHEYDFRISTLPLLYGEKIVIRVYNSLGDHMTLDNLAYDKEDEKKLRNLVRSPHGIVLLTGPTGSGKTTSLYAFLKELNKPGVNIQTVEDPVENQVAGTNQLQVNAKTGLTFATALRSILRQDPNIIMIGEIRDEETAHIAVQAAITGHLVFSTIHTNDAVTTVARLIDMGIEPYLVSDSLVGAISQRLMRKLCPHCKKEHILNEHEAKALKMKRGEKVYEAVGCHRCNHTGYKGRVPVFEILTIGRNIKNSIDEKKFGFEELTEAAKEDGLIFLRERAADLVKKGITSIEEFNSLISHVDE